MVVANWENYWIHIYLYLTSTNVPPFDPRRSPKARLGSERTMTFSSVIAVRIMLLERREKWWIWKIWDSRCPDEMQRSDKFQKNPALRVSVRFWATGCRHKCLNLPWHQFCKSFKLEGRNTTLPKDSLIQFFFLKSLVAEKASSQLSCVLKHDDFY